MKEDISDIVSRNIQALLDKHEMTGPQLATRVGVDKKTMWSVLNPQKGRSNPTTRVIADVARFFKLDYWVITFPDMPTSIIENKRLTSMIRIVGEVSDENREEIFRQIESISEKDRMQKRLTELEKGG